MGGIIKFIILGGNPYRKIHKINTKILLKTDKPKTTFSTGIIDITINGKLKSVITPMIKTRFTNLFGKGITPNHTSTQILHPQHGDVPIKYLSMVHNLKR
jgi:hypothetical protein